MPKPTHSLFLGYLMWIFGFMGAHRFYFGKPISGTIWFFSGGLLGIGWFIDLFLIPGMEASAYRYFKSGKYSYNVSWVLLTFFGYLGLHRFYLGKWLSGILYLCTGGFLLLGVLYDYWNLNTSISQLNRRMRD